MPKSPTIVQTGPTLSAHEAATYIGTTSKTLANWRSLGRGPEFIRLGGVGSRVVYRQAALDAFLTAQVVR